MKHHSIKIIVLGIALMLLSSLHAQKLWNGSATYSNWMIGGGSATSYTTYYRGADVMTNMPQNKTKTLFLATEKKQYSVMAMMGKPIITSQDFDPDTIEVPLFDIADGLDSVVGHRCLRVNYEEGNEMYHGATTVWLDTTYHIPFYYSLDDEVPYGLPVRTEIRMEMNGKTMNVVAELVSVVEGKVDDALFMVPSTDGAVTMSVDAEGNPILSGDTTGLFAPVHSDVLREVDSTGFRAAIANGRTVCMFTAVWCGPCRLMYPRLDSVAKQLGKGYRFIKVDIDHCPTIAREYECMTIPVIILFENGKELRRITSASYSEVDILNFIQKQ